MDSNYGEGMESLAYDLKAKVDEIEDLLRRMITNGVEITEDHYVNFHEAVGSVFEFTAEFEREFE